MKFVSNDGQFLFRALVLGKFESRILAGIEEKQILTPAVYEFVARLSTDFGVAGLCNFCCYVTRLYTIAFACFLLLTS